MFADIVSKNGNLLLDILVRGDCSIDDQETADLGRIGARMDVNHETIYDTHPWKVFGEGAKLSAPGVNKGKGPKPLTAADVRSIVKGDALCVVVPGKPEATLSPARLGSAAGLLERAVTHVALLGADETIRWKQNAGALVSEPPAAGPREESAVFRLTLH